MKRDYFILTILLALLVSISLFNCGSGSDSLFVSSSLTGGWIINPSSGNDKNFIVVSGTGAVTDHGFRGYAAAILNSSDSEFQVGLTSGASSLIVNATLTTADTADYTLYPSAETGTINRVPDMTACSTMSPSWWLHMTPDGGLTSPISSKPTRSPLNSITIDIYVNLNSYGDMSNAAPGSYFNVTGGKMICNGTGLDDLVVGLMATNAAEGLYPEYNTIKIVGIVNGAPSAGGLYNSEAASPWPVGSFAMVGPT